MKITKAAQAGSLESCDMLITVEPAKSKSGIQVKIESPAKKQFGEMIETEILEVIGKLGITDVIVSVIDKGALGYCVKARTETAMKRACMEE
ncbi:MAG: citrate lyase acyl carrier protein [Candidatus Heimdallarchaeota archaeon]